MPAAPLEHRRTTLRWVGVALTLAGVVIVGWGFFDFATAPAEEGAPWGFFLLPGGGVLALLGLALVSKSWGPVSHSFSDEELDELRRRRREGGSGND